jgi:hypothetical protein
MRSEKEVLDKMDTLNERVSNLRTNTSDIGKRNFAKYHAMLEALAWVCEEE